MTLMTITRRRPMLKMAGSLESTRVLTDEGYLLCEATISSEGVYPFRSDELDGPEGAEDIEWVYLGPDVLFAAKSIEDITHLPVTFGHPGPDVSPDNYNELSVGHVVAGTVGKVGPGNGLGSKLLVTNAPTIEAVQNHTDEEISLGFYADVEFAEGTFESQQYHKKFILPLNVNHVAIVPKGRAGTNVRIHNAMPNDLARSLAPSQVKALMRLRFKRMNFAETTSDDIVDVIWSDPEKELAVGELASRQAERRVINEVGPQPSNPHGRAQWNAAKEEYRQVYEQDIRKKVKRTARLGQFRGLISAAMATGLTAVLADHIWDKATGDETDLPTRIDNAPLGVGTMKAGAFDQWRRLVQFITRAADSPEVREKARRETWSTIEKEAPTMSPFGKRPTWSHANDKALQREFGVDNPSDLDAELQMQYNKLVKDMFNELYPKALDDAQKFARLQVGSMIGTVGIAGGGIAAGAQYYDEAKERILNWMDQGGLNSDGRTDMAADKTNDIKARIKRDLKDDIARAKRGYPKGFLYGTMGGALLGGILGYGVGRGVDAVAGAVSGLTGAAGVPTPETGEMYPYAR